MTVSKQLLAAAELLGKTEEYTCMGCCELLHSIAHDFFRELFFPKRCERSRARGYWMATLKENSCGEEVVQRRVYALLLAREIWLDENRPKRSKRGKA